MTNFNIYSSRFGQSTDNLPEGEVNLYLTNERVQAVIDSNTDLIKLTDLSWDNITDKPATLSETVNLTGNQSIDGNKLFLGTIRFSSATRQMITLWGNHSLYGIGVQNGTQYYRTGLHFAWFKSGSHNNSALNPGPGGTTMMVLTEDSRLGIANTTPQTELDVNGDITTRNIIFNDRSSSPVGNFKIKKYVGGFFDDSATISGWNQVCKITVNSSDTYGWIKGDIVVASHSELGVIPVLLFYRVLATGTISIQFSTHHQSHTFSPSVAGLRCYMSQPNNEIYLVTHVTDSGYNGVSWDLLSCEDDINIYFPWSPLSIDVSGLTHITESSLQTIIPTHWIT
ncbi:hypothetical protein [Limnospira fusiformis]|uniref:hypothetical protein n=1 Tax=Limnospira fusiformis TaxID=54297 RepID=UPI0034E09047